jgi:hypothetical protein
MTTKCLSIVKILQAQNKEKIALRNWIAVTFAGRSDTVEKYLPAPDLCMIKRLINMDFYRC